MKFIQAGSESYDRKSTPKTLEDAAATYERMIEIGAKKQSELRDVGGGIRVATVTDPFGNVLGIIENPNFKIEAEE